MRREPDATFLEAEAPIIVEKTAKVCLHVLGEGRSDVRVMRAATALAKAGFEVSIVDVEVEHTSPVEENIGNIRMKHIVMPHWFTARRSELRFFIVAIRTFFLSIIRMIQVRADVYHANDLMTLPACFIVATLLRKPLVFEIHDLNFPVPETQFTFWRRTGAFLYPFLLPRCAGVIAASPAHIREIHQRYHISNITLVRNVPAYRAVAKSDRLRNFLGLKPGVRIALYQGNIQPDRCLDKLVHAAAFLKQDTMIVIMGKNVRNESAQLETLIAREGVGDRIKIIPPVPYEDLLDWTASADIGLTILPLDYSLSVRTSLPNKLFEYLMAGLPVISSEMDAVREVIQTYHVGAIVSSFAPADIGEAINTLLAEQDVLAQMRESALHITRQYFNWEKEQYELIRLYTHILGKEKHSFGNKKLLS